MIGAARELDCFSSHILLKEPGKIEDNVDPLLSWRESIGHKGAEEVENTEANFKYQDRAEGQRPRNFIRPVSMSFSSR
ncbi:hypothetical protein BHM03_00020164 [Ensete ventricosum]|nr:hypothetical protein BHM03_00020164 [Ensete ventricosum]